MLSKTVAHAVECAAGDAGRSAAYLNEKVMAKITVGPVIGKVTDTTARILIEVDGDVQITCDATDTTSGLINGRATLLAWHDEKN